MVYRETARMPASERFGLSSQLRRAAVSIPANIAEGAARHGPKELSRFLYIARASAAEIDTLLYICRNLGYLLEESYLALEKKTSWIRLLLNRLIQKI